VLAVEPRLLVPRDIDTGHMCYAHLTVVYLDTAHYTGQQVRLRAPCVLPELSKLQEVGTILFGKSDYWWHIWDFVCSKMDTTSLVHFILCDLCTEYSYGSSNAVLNLSLCLMESFIKLMFSQ